MADYHSLLLRAIRNLPATSTVRARHAIYDRATKALVNQLRSLTPALPESDIERERRALEEAIAKVETEFPDAQPRANPSAASAQPLPEKSHSRAGQTRPAIDSAGATGLALDVFLKNLRAAENGKLTARKLDRQTADPKEKDKAIPKSDPFEDLDALEAEMSRLLGREGNAAAEDTKHAAGKIDRPDPNGQGKDKSTPGGGGSAHIGDGLRAFEEKLLKQPSSGPERPNPNFNEKIKAVEREKVPVDEATIKIEINRYIAQLRSNPSYIEALRIKERFKSLSGLMTSIVGFYKIICDNNSENSEYQITNDLSDHIFEDLAAFEVELEYNDALNYERYEFGLHEIILSQSNNHEFSVVINAFQEKFICTTNYIYSDIFIRIVDFYKKFLFNFIGFMIHYANGNIADYDAINETIRLLDEFIVSDKLDAKGSMIPDEKAFSAISTFVDSLERRFGTEAVEEVLRRRLKASGNDVELQFGSDDPETVNEQRSRLATNEETQEILAHAEAHQWRNSPVRRSPRPAARRFLHVNYARWLDAGIEIPAHILKKADPDLYGALFTEIGTAGLREEGIVTAHGQEEIAAKVGVPNPPPRDQSQDEALAIKAKRSQVGLSVDRAFRMPAAPPGPEKPVGEEPRLPSEDEIREIIAHGQAHQWKHRRVRRSAGPASYAFFTETYAKWLQLGIEIPPLVIKRADEDLYNRLYQELGKDGMRSRLKHADPSPS